MRRAAIAFLMLVAIAVPTLGQDPVKVDPKHYSVVLENDQVRVLRGVLGPGDKTPMHDHPATVVVPLTDASGRFTLADGKTQEQEMTAGTPAWIGAEKHAVENAGKTQVEVIIVELVAARAGLSAEDEAAVRAIDAEWGRAASAGDGNAIGALYASNATLLPPMESVVQGEAAKKYWVDFINTFSGPTELTTTTVEGRGDLAYSVGTYRMTLTPKKAGARPLPTEEGKYVTVLKKQADGSWKIVYDMWSPNLPPGNPPGKQ